MNTSSATTPTQGANAPWPGADEPYDAGLVATFKRLIRDLVAGVGSAAGWLLYLWLLIALASLLPRTTFTPGHEHFILLIGAVGIWRYSLGFIHFIRAMVFMHWQYPRLRRRAQALGAEGLPSHVYFLVTTFRINTETSAAVYRSVIREAGRSGVPSTIVASLVELADEQLVRAIWDRVNPPSHVKLRIVRVPGTGKRDGLAQGFRAISRDMPPDDAVVAVIDGDTVLQRGVIERSAPYFKLLPQVGGLTTNEFCKVEGGFLMSQWHALRFAQRHLNMCSMALSRRVLTLTGRMSLIRADIVTDPRFIDDVENDALDHWRLGQFKFLTGDDKSSWYSLMRLGYDTFYVPDASINTMEHPPHNSFWVASRKLMFRWYGNSLRQNSRATDLGPGRLGWFTYYVLWDQRFSMWTCLFGLTAATFASLKYGGLIFVAYALWVGISRLVLSIILLFTGHRVGPAFPLLLYYNQIVGAVMKIYVFFHLDQQSWTRQKTVLVRDLSGYQRWLNSWSSTAMMLSAVSLYLSLIYTIV